MNNLTEPFHNETGIFEFNISNFDEMALSVFRFQASQSPVYKRYLETIHVLPGMVSNALEIPFLPISFFKTHKVVTTSFVPELVFESSGTTGAQTSRHLVKKAGLYTRSFRQGFEYFYGPPENWCILALLPSYLERKNSSLVRMAEELISRTKHPDSGFYLYQFDQLANTLIKLEQKKQKTLLLGVTFALLDFAKAYPMHLNHTIVMETGGMKGRKEEMTRQAVHDFLKQQFQLSEIHSEYGMTELLSQAYAAQNGIFRTPNWMRILLRSEDDPFELTIASQLAPGQATNGIINIIDLANLYSASFIATDDIGKLYPNGDFEVIGRLDNSDIRGCSLLSV